MAAQRGRDLLVKIHDGSANFEDENYIVVGGFKSNGIEIGGESIDITNKDSGGFKEILAGAGTVSMSVSGDGVFVDDASFQRVHDHMLARTHPDCKIVVPDFAEYTGAFAIDTLSMSGNDNEAVTYNISLSSAGAITVTAV